MRAERHHGAPLLVGVETLEQAARAEATEELVEHRERQEALGLGFRVRVRVRVGVGVRVRVSVRVRVEGSKLT